MAKRFVDSEIWDREWFMKLQPAQKCLVLHAWAKCDIAGYWRPNWTLIPQYIGTIISEQDLLEIDGGRRFVKIKEGKIKCVGFVEFQNGTLKKSSAVHRKILKIIEQNEGVTEPLPNPSLGVMEGLGRGQGSSSSSSIVKVEGGAGGNKTEEQKVMSELRNVRNLSLSRVIDLYTNLWCLLRPSISEGLRDRHKITEEALRDLIRDFLAFKSGKDQIEESPHDILDHFGKWIPFRLKAKEGEDRKASDNSLPTDFGRAYFIRGSKKIYLDGK